MGGRRIVAAMVCASIAGCSLFVDTSGLSDDSASTTVDGSSADGISDTAPGEESIASDGGKICPSGIGPAMVLVPGNATTPSFCIDSTEVTSTQYDAFIASGPSLSMLPAECSFKSQFTSVTSVGEIPANVDWCDAVAFCEYAGKRLCGKIGGGSNDYLAYADITKSQWFYACTGGGQTAYPYGNDFDPTLCNGAAYDAGGPIAAGSDTQCVGGFPGIYDMSGNMWEWEDSCTPGDSGSNADDPCRTRGGTWVDGEGTMACGFDDLEHFNPTRGSPGGYMGIRCCAD